MYLPIGDRIYIMASGEIPMQRFFATKNELLTVNNYEKYIAEFGMDRFNGYMQAINDILALTNECAYQEVAPDFFCNRSAQVFRTSLFRELGKSHELLQKLQS